MTKIDCDSQTGESLNVYVVKTNNNLAHHHGLHTNTAPYLATNEPKAGDEIYLVLKGFVTRYYKAGKFVAATYTVSGRAEQNGESVFVDLSTHAGRSPMLGEDGLELAHGDDFLAAVWVPEMAHRKAIMIGGFEYGEGWSHAPCNCVVRESYNKETDQIRRKFKWNLAGLSDHRQATAKEVKRK